MKTILKEQRDFERAYLIQGACEGRFKVAECAERLGVSAQRVKQLKRAYREKGAKAFIHGNKGKIPKSKIPEETRNKIIELKNSSKYKNTNFFHFWELVKEYEGINCGYTAIRTILQSAGITSNKKRRIKEKKSTHAPRPRRACFGELLQADASQFDWLETGKRIVLHGYQDDATGKITGLFLCKNECLLGYLEVTRRTIEKHGIPLSLYPDRVGIFFVNPKHRDILTIEEELLGLEKAKTQMGKILDELGVEVFAASSPEAKGRIERLWGTLQGRLPTEFRLRDIKTIEEANQFLLEYVDIFNQRFAVEPRREDNCFVPLCDLSFLDTLLAVKIVRKTNREGVFSLDNHKFIIDNPVCHNRKVTLLLSDRIGFKAMIYKTLYDVRYVDYHDNKHMVKRMPEVTKTLIDKYLRSTAKFDNKNQA